MNLNVVNGGSIIDFFKGRKGASPQVREFLQNYGNLEIIEMRVCRKPIQKVIDVILNIFSFAEWEKRKKKMHYDEIFHLYMLVKLSDGNTYLLEKNEVVVIKPYKVDPEADCTGIKLNKKLTLGQLIRNGELFQGSDKFWLYNAKYNNCQVFVMSLLFGSGLGDDKVYSFVKQNSEYLVNGILEKISNFTTDFAMRIHAMMYGQGKCF